MCLIFVAHRVSASVPMLAVANRDELHARATAPAHFWTDSPSVLAGRDLEAGGTWLGVSRGGRFAALTNYRAAGRVSTARSRGELTANFLRGQQRAADYAREVAAVGAQYNGFTLLVHDGANLAVCSNRSDPPRALAPGIYGLSNAGLNAAWPKVQRGKSALEQLLTGTSPPAPESLLELLADRRVPPDTHLPDTGVGLERERELSPMFILADEYGTRCSTVVARSGDDLCFVERRFGVRGQVLGETREFVQIRADTMHGSRRP